MPVPEYRVSNNEPDKLLPGVFVAEFSIEVFGSRFNSLIQPVGLMSTPQEGRLLRYSDYLCQPSIPRWPEWLVHHSICSFDEKVGCGPSMPRSTLAAGRSSYLKESDGFPVTGLAVRLPILP
jgi:hypothetical protein